MGGAQSSRTERNTESVKEKTRHSPLPPPVNYPWPLEYKLIDVPVKISVEKGFSCDLSSNIATHYEAFSQQCQQGFNLLQFFMIPGVFSGPYSSTYQFQAIFATSSDCKQHSKLEVVRSTVEYIILIGISDDLVTDMAELIQQVKDTSSRGGRLVCLESSLSTKSPGFVDSLKGKTATTDIDVLFQMPVQSPSTMYTYKAVNFQIMTKVTEGFPAGKIQTESDFSQQLQSYLSEGWKLVDIFYDSEFRMKGIGGSRWSQNSVWFFEKELDRINDNKAQYEGAVIEYWLTIKCSFSGRTTAKGSWNDVVVEMGRQGWEFACLVRLRDQFSPPFSHKLNMKILLIFQRKLLR